MRQPEADAQPLPLPLPLPLNTLQAPVLHDARAGAGGSLRPSSDDLRAVGGDASARAKRARRVLDRLLRLLLLLVDRDQALRPRVQHAALVEVLPQLPGDFDQARRNDRVSGNRFSSAVRSGFRPDGLVARFQRYFLTRTEAAGSHLPWSLRLRLRLRLRFDFRLLRHAAERRQVLRLYSDREHRTL